MPDEITLTLDSVDVLQLLDGLRILEESWRNTAIYLRDGYFPDDAFVCEECNDEHEAESIAGHYKHLISDIERQMDEQRDGNAK